MKLYLIRHAIAEEHAPGRRDAERALTPEGQEKMRRAARGLREIGVEIERILTSPIRRARETADIVAEALGRTEVRELPELSPGSEPSRLLASLEPWRDADALALVGHEPDLGQLASFLLAGSPSTCSLPFRKGGVACFDGELLPGMQRLQLEWLLTPKQLRALGRS